MGVEWLIDRLRDSARIVTLIQDSGTNYMSKCRAATAWPPDMSVKSSVEFSSSILLNS